MISKQHEYRGTAAVSLVDDDLRRRLVAHVTSTKRPQETRKGLGATTLGTGSQPGRALSLTVTRSPLVMRQRPRPCRSPKGGCNRRSARRPRTPRAPPRARQPFQCHTYAAGDEEAVAVLTAQLDRDLGVFDVGVGGEYVAHGCLLLGNRGPGHALDPLVGTALSLALDVPTCQCGVPPGIEDLRAKYGDSTEAGGPPGNPYVVGKSLVGDIGFEPVTSSVSGQHLCVGMRASVGSGACAGSPRSATVRVVGRQFGRQ
jgi:hypothetical protein